MLHIKVSGKVPHVHMKSPSNYKSTYYLVASTFDSSRLVFIPLIPVRHCTGSTTRFAPLNNGPVHF